MNDAVRCLAWLAVASVISGCSGASFAPGSATSSPMGAHGTGGGEFIVHDSGNYRLDNCEKGADGHFELHGDGHGSFLHAHSEDGKLTGKVSDGECVWSGSATLTSDLNKKNSVTFSLSFNGGSTHLTPCDAAFGVGYEVTGGTGKFSRASGSGTVKFICADGAYDDHWNGTLKY